MIRIIPIIILLQLSITLYAQEEPYRGGDADGYSLKSDETPFSLPASFQPYIGGNGDGYTYDSSINFSPRAYITMYYPYAGDTADGWTGYPIFNVPTTVPLTLLSFNGSRQTPYHLLTWRTANEYNVSHFELERSGNGIVFYKIGNVRANGFSGTAQYACTDSTPLKQYNYYRLKSVDRDGSYSYSSVIMLRAEDAGIVSVYPNPAKNIVQIRFSNTAATGKITWSIYDQRGALLLMQRSNNVYGELLIDISKYPAGMYRVKVESENTNYVFSIIKE